MRKSKFLFILFFLIALVGSTTKTYSQDILAEKINRDQAGATLINVLVDISKKHPARIYFMSEWLNEMVVDETMIDKSLEQVLEDFFYNKELDYVKLNVNTIIIFKNPERAKIKRAVLSEATRTKRTIHNVVVGSVKPNQLKSGVFKIFGQVVDAKSQTILAGATIWVPELSKGVNSGIDGKFELELPAGQSLISINYASYEEKIFSLDVNGSGELKIELEETPRMLNEVVIVDKSTKDILTTSIGKLSLSMREIKRAPTFLGEADIIRQIQILPGVTTVGEAASGFNVRGGSVDQNLILYEGMPVFNSSHLFGFFSAFNAEAVRDATFYKGGVPAEFGGRVSSVLDIQAREGGLDKWQMSGGIGLVSTNGMVSGPIKKDRTSVITSFRTTYSNWLLNTVKSNYLSVNQSKVNFYDGTVKVSHLIGPKTKLALSGYLSADKFRLRSDSTYSWNTGLMSLKISHAFNQALSSSIMLGYGNYNYIVSSLNTFDGFNLFYKINYPVVKATFNLKKGNHELNFGADGTYYAFQPGKLVPSSPQSSKIFKEIENQRSLEAAFFAGDQFSLSDRIHMETGIRFSTFMTFGEDSIYQYKAGEPREPGSILGVRYVAPGSIASSFHNLEPRLGIRFNVDEWTTLKLGYNRMSQYLHLVTNTTAITPIDIWQPSGPYFKPQVGNQVSIGFFKTSKNRTYEIATEAYWKVIQNIVEFKDGAKLILNDLIETDLLQGRGRMYGIETQLTKQKGTLTGSMSYSYSRSFRTVSNSQNLGAINDGIEYPSNFDQPHVVNVNWKYSFSKRHFFTGSFTYRTGRPITIPTYAFTVDNFTVTSFSARNQYKIPDYHRLDVAFVIEGNHKRKKLWDGTWTLSVYNLYGRKNPYSVFFNEVKSGILRPYQLAIIGVPLPSLSYTFKL
ncbi:MAG: TonB-dependent receptor [Cyclobacteriaceae bacterium]|nr:TonB-dependent receptor [Cyclobacteriaceae bacterium]